MGSNPGIGPTGPHDDGLEESQSITGGAAAQRKKDEGKKEEGKKEEIGPNGPHGGTAKPTKPADQIGPTGPHNT